MIYSLSDFKTELKKKIFGQDEAVEMLCTTIYRHLIRAKVMEWYETDLPGGFNILIKGDTGCGKSFMIKEAAKLAELPVAFINCKSISQEGWAGRSLIELISNSMTQQQLYKYPIIVLDEFDKLLMANFSSSGDNVSSHLQNSILTQIEGQIIDSYLDGLTRIHSMDTKRFLFIFAGAFSNKEDKKNTIGFKKECAGPLVDDTYDKLIAYGAIPELAGRIKGIIELNKLNTRDYLNIMDSGQQDYHKWLLLLNELECPDVQLNKKAIIKKALTKNLGARGLLQEIEKEINKAIIKNERLLTFYRLLGNKEEPLE